MNELSFLDDGKPLEDPFVFLHQVCTIAALKGIGLRLSGSTKV